jgi:hypothetical protein
MIRAGPESSYDSLLPPWSKRSIAQRFSQKTRISGEYELASDPTRAAPERSFCFSESESASPSRSHRTNVSIQPALVFAGQVLESGQRVDWHAHGTFLRSKETLRQVCIFLPRPIIRRRRYELIIQNSIVQSFKAFLSARGKCNMHRALSR